MKKTNYNNTLKVRMSEELVRVLKSPKIQNGKMLQNLLKHANFSQMVRALIVRAYEDEEGGMYTKTWLNKMFDWDNIPEVQEYRFRQNGGHLMEKRRERDKLKDQIKQYMDRRKAGLTTKEIVDEGQLNLFTID